MSKIFVATYNTESSDRGVVGYWTSEPTEEELEAYFRKIMPDEFFDEDDGSSPGYDRFVYWDVFQLEEINE